MTVAFPALDFDAEWTRTVPAQSNRSGWTGRSKTIIGPGLSTWSASITFEALTTELEERAMRVFIESLDGIVGITNVPRACQQHVGAKPTVDTGATAGSTLPLTGMTASTTILKAGQFMTVPLPSGHKRLVMLTADLVTDGTGEAVATFKPSLGEIPAGGATVETLDPYCPMRSTTNEIAIATQDGVSVVSIDMEEAL